MQQAQQVKQRELATSETGLPMTHGHTVHTEFIHCKTWMIKYLPRINVVEIGKPRPMGQIQPMIGFATVQEQSRAFKWLGEKVVAIYFMTCENL